MKISRRGNRCISRCSRRNAVRFPLRARPGRRDFEIAPLFAASVQRTRKDAGTLGQEDRGGKPGQAQDRHLSSRCSSAARRRSSTTRRATVSSISSGRCRDRPPGRFPSTEVFELPFIAARRGIVNAKACAGVRRRQSRQRDQGRQAPELLGARPRPRSTPTSRSRPWRISRASSCAIPTRLAGEALKALGATAIGMPMPQVPESLAQKVIDGGVVPWEVVPAIKVQELRQVPHRDPGLADALYGELLPGHEQGQVRRPAGRPQGGDRQELGQAFADLAGNMWDDDGRSSSRWSRSAATPSERSPRKKKPGGSRPASR